MKEHLYLEEEDWEIVQGILSEYKSGDIKFYAFGSRAKGAASKSSDIDIMVSGHITDTDLADIRTRFIESDLPVHVDLTHLDTMSSNFFNMIKNDLIGL